jgi:hypothetical protein
MKRVLILTALLFSLASCARLPELQPDDVPGRLEGDPDFYILFPQGRWQLYHAIEATVPGRGKSMLTGVTVLSSSDRTIRCALMTVEGFVLFSGRYDGELTIDRCVSPFDRPEFARGLMEDLMLLFFAPEAALCRTGALERQGRVLRCTLPDRVTDIVRKTEGTWEVLQYTSQNRLYRSIEAGRMVRIADRPFAERLTLRSYAFPGYQLELKLLEALPLD